MKFDDYEDVRDGLSGLPITWYPDLICKMVEYAYKRRVFVKGGASILVSNVEKRIGKSRQVKNQDKHHTGNGVSDLADP